MLKDSTKVATYWRAIEALRQKNVTVEEERVVQVMMMMFLPMLVMMVQMIMMV